MIALDVECYPNMLLVVFRDDDTGEWTVTSDRATIRRMLNSGTTYSFNGNRYDLPVIECYLADGDYYARSCAIVRDDVRFWPRGRHDHIDLYDVAPGVQVGLKLYGGRMGSRTIRDLPYDPTSSLTDAQKLEVIDYCKNDVLTLFELRQRLDGQIRLRQQMSEQYGVDLRSKSDAQIAEAVLLHELGTPKPVDISAGQRYRYRAPAWLWYETPDLQILLDDVLRSEFVVSNTGGVDMPPALNGRTVTLGDSVYRLGVGGLHSSEQSVTHTSGEHLLIDCDVASYYPSMILGLGLNPPQFGSAFASVYRSVYDRRLAAKRSGDDVAANTLKIVLNGTFGKLASKYSKLYAPELFFHVTVTGQLALLMLIESLHRLGVPVVSGNTDGIVARPTADQLPAMRAAIALWESVTGYAMEETHYRSLHCRDVNNYLAIKADGKVKCRGAFAGQGLMKNPQMPIIGKALVSHIADGTPLDDAVRSASITDLLTVRTVRGGGSWRGRYLGKVVRWYWSTEGDPITYSVTGHRVATSDGARPAMSIPDAMPADVDWERYITAAREALAGVGL